MKIQQEIARLTATLQSLTRQRLLALREGRRSEADQIASVQVDIDNKIQQLEKKHMISVLITLTFAFMISFVCFAIQALLQERELQKLKKRS